MPGTLHVPQATQCTLTEGLVSKKKSAFSGTPKFNVLTLKVDFSGPAHFEYFCTVFLRILCLFFWFNCFLFLDVLQAGVWKHRQDLKSNKLKKLADSLPAFVLCSRAVSTNVKYKNAWLNWKKWEKDNLGVNVFPVSPFFLSLHLIDKFQSCNSPSPIEAAVYGVKWAHDIAGVPSPIESTLVRQLLEVAKRLLGKPAQGKQAVSFDVITKVVEKFNTPLASLSDLRTCFIFVLAFAGIMRSHEIINIKRSQISTLPDHMSIFCQQDIMSRFCYREIAGQIACPPRPAFGL